MIAIEQLRMKIIDLESRLIAKTPDYKIMLAEIHGILLADPEMIHMLKTDTEVAIIVDGLRRFKQIEIPIPVKKAGMTPKGPLKLDDF